MANIEINQLPAASSLTGAEEIPMDQNSDTVKATAQDIANLVDLSLQKVTDGVGNNVTDNSIFIEGDTSVIEKRDSLGDPKVKLSQYSGKGRLELYNSDNYQTNLKNSLATDTREIELPNANGTLALLTDVGLPYKVYVAILTQSGTTAPIVTVLENTTGQTITWSYGTVGYYLGTYSTTFNAAKTVIFIGSSPYFYNGVVIGAGVGSTGDFIILSAKDSSGNYVNGALYNTAIEVRIYP